MAAGVTDIVRDSYASSLERWAKALGALGEAPGAAREAVRRFRAHDEATFAAQYRVKEDGCKLLATSREAAQQLEKPFEAERTGSD
jgi:hypothetical protein